MKYCLGIQPHDVKSDFNIVCRQLWVLEGLKMGENWKNWKKFSKKWSFLTKIFFFSAHIQRERWPHRIFVVPTRLCMPPPQLLETNFPNFADTVSSFLNRPSCQKTGKFDLPENACEPHIGPHTHYAPIYGPPGAYSDLFLALARQAGLPAGLRPAGSLALTSLVLVLFQRNFKWGHLYIYYFF